MPTLPLDNGIAAQFFSPVCTFRRESISNGVRSQACQGERGSLRSCMRCCLRGRYL